MDWYYVADGQRVGPVSETQLAELAGTGAILFDTLVWREGLDTWRPYGEVHVSPRPPAASLQDANVRAASHSPASSRSNRSLVCPKCGANLGNEFLNSHDLAPCSGCRAALQVEAFPALFRPVAAGRAAEFVLEEGQSSCFYHPQNKAVTPCDACGRFLCALCDCEIKGQHLCPGCLESGQKKRSIAALERVRVLYDRQALVLAILPLFISGIAAIYIALRYRKEPGSLVKPMRWAFPTALVLGSLQTAFFLFIIIRAWTR